MKRTICPIRYLAYMAYEYGDENSIYCIKDKCAWYHICQNLSNLDEKIINKLIPRITE